MQQRNVSWRIAVSTKSKSRERAEKRKLLVSPRTCVAVVFNACKCCNTFILLPPQCYHYYFHDSTWLCLRSFECRISARIVRGFLPSYLCCSSVQWEKLVLVGMIWNPGEKDQKNPIEHRVSKNVLGLNRKEVGKHCLHLARHLIPVTDLEAFGGNTSWNDCSCWHLPGVWKWTLSYSEYWPHQQSQCP